MKSQLPETPPAPRPGAFKRKTVGLAREGLVRAEPLAGGGDLPLVVRPHVRHLDAAAWAGESRDFIESRVRRHGGLLFRGFDLRTADDFARFAAAAVGDDLLEYRERSSPRTRVEGNVYTSTDYPADQSIFLHNENSYQQTWPLRIFFFCRAAPPVGGETPIADCRRIFARLGPRLRERFVERRVMYVRNFGDGFGLPWQTVFQTADRRTVEEHCRRADIAAEWKEGDRLRTRAVRPAAARHPRTGEAVWFNHATFFHVTTLPEGVRDELLAEFADAEELPTNSFYGDGAPIEPETLEELREAYRRETVAFRWEAGDVLLLDNMLAAHGRAPYEGPREILVGMAAPHSWSQVRLLETGECE
ncbi:MAG TPA: TauD/TfdA family dioxygenase [Pyrinomonadaceae bacterium]|nr:TauD/TfdA family dioxygenase [Pyrinomonadaceae bacterium]